MSPASTERVADAVYERVREEIFTGALPPGTRLSVPALAEQLQVSRSPVREAVTRLVHERLAREEPRRGAVVARVGPPELATLYEVREVLEGLVARLAVENTGRRLVDRLAEVLHEHEQAVETADVARHMEADMRFHTLVRQAAGNSEAIRVLDEIQTRVRLAMYTTTVTAGPRRALEDHQAIFAAIRSADPAEAERTARAHVVRLRAALLDQTDTSEDNI